MWTFEGCFIGLEKKLGPKMLFTNVTRSMRRLCAKCECTYIHEVLHAGTKESAQFPTVYGHSDVDVQRDTYDQECEITDSHTGNVYVGGRVHGPVWDNHQNHQNVACEAKNALKTSVNLAVQCGISFKVVYLCSYNEVLFSEEDLCYTITLMIFWWFYMILWTAWIY